MKSTALSNFEYLMRDATDLSDHFDRLNSNPPPPEIEVLKRASLVMALAALETYFEDRLVEAINQLCIKETTSERLRSFFDKSLEIDLKTFNSPNTDRVKFIYRKYLNLDVTEGWVWNNSDQDKAREELNQLVKKRGDIAHRSLRPVSSDPQPKEHAVTRDGLRRHIYFIYEIAKATDVYLEKMIFTDHSITVASDARHPCSNVGPKTIK